ncbi:uncharacterized protein LOC131217311 [Magnolia sinica]|uniref:uncharacterized protein LOC131217311 n=1 Tax=Magnolia sinica TaxID=86752 RepID=UPI002659961E|nr:uncharacterized protein LOC131217311 [Magnolia sinica]
MKARMKRRFLPLDYETTSFQEFLTLRRDNLTMEYTQRYYDLVIRCHLTETGRQQVAHYCNGLQFEIQRELVTIWLNSVDEAYQMARKVQDQKLMIKCGNLQGGGYASTRSTTSGSTSRPQPFMPCTNLPRDYKIGQNAAQSASNPLPQNGDTKGKSVAVTQGRSTNDYFKCGGRGHYGTECPSCNLQFCETKDFITNQVEDEHANDPEDDEQELEEGLDGLNENKLSLVVRRILTAPKEEAQENWLRTNIFHTRVSCGEKAVKVIIDRGSSMNVVSQSMVDKLKLKPQTHPKPYKIASMNDTFIPVTKRCLVNFSLGRYEESLWCDIIPMKVTHILLGRPWIYDKDVTHKGRKNTYSFIYKGKPITLNPMKDDKLEEAKSASTLLSMARFMEESRERGIMYALVRCKINPIDNVFAQQPDILDILSQFQDLVPDELPSELPPMRDIQHVIDLVPGAPLPNLRA